jgi:L-aspartate oxidase
MTSSETRDAFDVVVIGSGIAGLYAALQAHEHGSRVLVVTKGGIDEAGTRYAQGGIAAAVGPGDSPEAHLQDTLDAGAGLVNEEAARILVFEAKDRIADLVRYGVHFDATNGEVSLGREAAHSAARILHAGGDSTGLEIELSLSSLARREGVTILEHTMAERVLTPGAGGRASGVEVLDVQTGAHRTYEAGVVILATGGAGQMYRTTTNPAISTGDGIELAYASGAEVMDLEFTQFHPTVLRLPGVPVFLISEAVRGEGALLFNVRGERFMPKYDARAELAPRDVVARAAHAEMHATGSDHVLLDITDHDRSWLAARFPQIFRTCLEYGLDMSRDRIPVSHGAHYTMGGVRTNTWGETTIPGLFAVGEVACTGVHGANRLASNSLLETVVFARRAVQRLFETPSNEAPPALEETADALALPERDSIATEVPSAGALKELMWTRAGIERDGPGLLEAARILATWQGALPPGTDRASRELRSLVVCGRLATEAALLREESRGAHYRLDFPEPREEWRRRIVYRASGERSPERLLAGVNAGRA